ncbi:MAG: BlaI/MecI/CopY family transcriptional regulator [Sedimentisphaerales bacterium]|nr:BlaI/MecI/CopY family transcriptional regulator [Sedimentisphaerales bacterium]
MKKIPKISEAEWQVMKLLWKKSPLTANDIVENLSKETPWKRETIRTLINRLVRKKALSFRKQSRQYLYFTLVDESECIMEETRSFLDRVHGGSIEPMLAAFVENEKLTTQQITRLRQILDGQKKQNEKKQITIKNERA